MKSLNTIAFLFFAAASMFSMGCQTTDSAPKPERERLSSIPHNMPESWEGQAGFPGAMGGGY